MENIVLNISIIIVVFFVINYIKKKYLINYKNFNLIKIVLMGVLIALIFSKNIFDDIHKRNYEYLAIYVVFIGYFFYLFIKELKKIQTLK